MSDILNKSKISLNINKLLIDLEGLKLEKNELIVFIVTLIALLVAKGTSLLPITYAIDDYRLATNPINYALTLVTGRFASFLIFKFFMSMGLHPTHVNVFTGFLTMLSFVWMGIIVCRLWGINNNVLLSSLVISMITLHPYTVEMFTFKVIIYALYLNFFFAFLGLYLIRLSLSNFVIGIILMTFSIGCYQIIINFLFLTICISFIITLLNNYNNSSSNLKQILKFSKEVPQIIALSLSIFLYFLINFVIQRIAQVTMVSRGKIIGFSDISERLRQLKNIVITIFFKNEAIFPLTTKVILVVLFGLVILFISRKIISKKGIIQNKIILLTLTLLLIGASIIGIIGVIIPFQQWWPAPRVLSSTGILVGGILVIGCLSIQAKFRTILFFLAFPVIFSFIGVNNHILSDQMKVNMRDIQKANRIIARLEAHPDFNKVKRLAVLGGRWNYQIPIKTATMDMNISSFLPSWSKREILKEVSGYDFGSPTEEDVIVAEEYYKNHLHWPHPESVTIVEDLAIICLE